MFDILFILSFVPLLFYLVDGYYEGNIKKGIFQIIAFVVTSILLFIFIKAWGWIGAFCIPIIIFIVAFSKKRNSIK